MLKATARCQASRRRLVPILRAVRPRLPQDETAYASRRSPSRGQQSNSTSHERKLAVGKSIAAYMPENDNPTYGGTNTPFRYFRPLTWKVVLDTLNASFSKLEIELRQLRIYDNLDMEPSKFWDIFHAYKAEIETEVDSQLRVGPKREASTSEKLAMRIIKAARDDEQIRSLIKVGLYNRIMEKTFTPQQLKRQTAIADCRYPMEWFPTARQSQRTLHLHVGPTNSGKTYNALKRLEQAKNGCYAGPLRLLAQEIYARMNAKGKPTWLITGDDQQFPSIPYDESSLDSRRVSCTVEMMDFSTQYEVAVIDEVQMAADASRGHAWTAAIMGVAAKEVHLCGEERTVPVIEEIARSLGEQLIIHRYNRLSPLAVMDQPLDSMSRLEKGDCIVCFSVMRIHAMKGHVERITGKRCAIIYGSLPSEVRAQQARLFNDPNSEYDYLVASDAVGMGLNLAIGRVLFDTVRKRSRAGLQELTTPEIRQIGGRAGRFRTALQDIEKASEETKNSSSSIPVEGDSSATTIYPATPPAPTPPHKIGLVTAFEHADLQIIRRSMDIDPEPITRIGIFPTNDMIEMFYTYFPVGIPYSFILARILDMSQVSGRFFFSDISDTIQIADIIQSVPNLSISDRIKISYAPVSLRTPELSNMLREMAEAIGNQSGGGLLDLKYVKFEVMDQEVQPTRTYLRGLEGLHKRLILYNWMSFRFPGVFTQRALAFKAKEAVEANIDKCLSMWKYSDIDKTRLRDQPDTEVAKVVREAVRSQIEEIEDDAEEDSGLVQKIDGSAAAEHSIPADDAGNYPELEDDLDAMQKGGSAADTSTLTHNSEEGAQHRTSASSL